jgi:hypothetical protein
MLLLRSLAQMLVGLVMCWAYYLGNLAVVIWLCNFSLVWVALGGLALWFCNLLLLRSLTPLTEWLSQPPRQTTSRWKLSLRELLI